MSLLMVGLSHRTAPLPLLERFSMAEDDVIKALHDLQSSAHINESLILTTCNRVEIYADVDRFHAAVQDLTALLTRQSGIDLNTLRQHLYVHYDQAAVEHCFSVAAGLDSMVVGESQILGQVRAAYRTASANQATGRKLHELCQRALRVGKVVRSQTQIDRTGASLVSAALDHARAVLGSFEGLRALIIGAGSFGALAGHTLRRYGATDLVVANRTAANGQRLAQALDAEAISLSDVERELSRSDLVLGCTGSTGIVLPYDVVEKALHLREDRQLVILDLALPHDVDVAVCQLPWVTYLDLASLQGILRSSVSEDELSAATQIVEGEAAEYENWQRSDVAAPTIAALRARAAEVVEVELSKLNTRLPELTGQAHDEVARTVRRVVSTLLHTPTVRVKELTTASSGLTYTDALRELFDLDPDVPSLLAATTEQAGGWSLSTESPSLSESESL